MKEITEKMIEKVMTAFTEDVEHVIKMCLGKTITYSAVNQIMWQIEKKKNEAVKKMKSILSENEDPVQGLDDALRDYESDCDYIMTTELEDKVCCNDFEHLMNCFSDMRDDKYLLYFSELED